MAAITFPTSPTLNQEFTAGGRTWVWDGTVWDALSYQNTGGAIVPTQTGNSGELLVTDGTDASWSNTVTANSATVPAIIAKGATSHTGNLQSWQNSGGTNVASISASGSFSGNNVSGVSFDGTPTTPADVSSASKLGFIGMPQVATATNLALTAAHAGKHIYSTGTGQMHTIPANSAVPLQIGTTFVFINGPTSPITIAITSDILLTAVTGLTGSKTLESYGMATAVKIAATTWIISGSGLN